MHKCEEYARTYSSINGIKVREEVKEVARSDDSGGLFLNSAMCYSELGTAIPHGDAT